MFILIIIFIYLHKPSPGEREKVSNQLHCVTFTVIVKLMEKMKNDLHF